MDNENELQETLQNSDETLDLELEQGTEEKPQADVAAELQRLKEQNKALYARTKEAETKLKELKPQVKPEVVSKTDEIGDVLSLRDKGYSEGEILKLREYSRKMNVSLSEVANEPFIKAGIEQERSKRSAADATPAPSSRGITVNGKTFSQMTPQERQANWQSIIRKK